jgi:hypothetical protein
VAFIGQRSDEPLKWRQFKQQLQQDTTRSVRNLHPENIRALCFALNLENWEDVYEANDVDDKVQCFNKTIGNMLDTNTPAKVYTYEPKR